MPPHLCQQAGGATDLEGVDVRKRGIHSRARKPMSDWITPPVRDEAVGPLLSALGSVVYAIRTRDGLIKIGFTADLGQRYSALGRMGNILGWAPGTRADEAAIHRSFHGLAVQGREYYPDHPRVLSLVNEMRRDLGQEPLAQAS